MFNGSIPIPVPPQWPALRVWGLCIASGGSQPLQVNSNPKIGLNEMMSGAHPFIGVGLLDCEVAAVVADSLLQHAKQPRRARAALNRRYQLRARP